MVYTGLFGQIEYISKEEENEIKSLIEKYKKELEEKIKKEDNLRIIQCEYALFKYLLRQ